MVVVVRAGMWVMTFQLPMVIAIVWRLEKGELWLLNPDPATSCLDYELL